MIKAMLILFFSPSLLAMNAGKYLAFENESIHLQSGPILFSNNSSPQTPQIPDLIRSLATVNSSTSDSQASSPESGSAQLSRTSSQNLGYSMTDQELHTLWMWNAFHDRRYNEMWWRLEKMGANINGRDGQGYTLLHRTALVSYSFTKKAPKALAKMIEMGALIDAHGPQKETPLHCAAQDCDKTGPKKVKVLLRAGSNVNAQDQNGRTPLHYAVITGNIEVIKMLIEVGADTKIVDTTEKAQRARDLTTNEKIIKLFKPKSKQSSSSQWYKNLFI